MPDERLHLLTPRSHRTSRTLIEERYAAGGDLILDFLRFPPVLYEVTDEKEILQDVTSSFLQAPDYVTVAQQWLLQFTKHTRLQEFLSLEGFGFWWTLNSLNFLPAWSELGNVFFWIDLLAGIRMRRRLAFVRIHGRHEAIIHIARQILDGIPLEVDAEGGRDPVRPSSRLAGLPLRAARVLWGLFCLPFASFRPPMICFLSSTNTLRTATVGIRQKPRDVYLGGVARVLRERGWRVLMVENYGMKASWQGLWARRLFFPTDLLFLVSYVRFVWPGRSRRIVRKWRARWTEAQASLAPQMQYRGCDLSSLLLPVVRREFLYGAPLLEFLTRSWQWILARWRPRLVYINCSYTRPAISAIVAAKRLGILTMEQQHGVISRNHLAYLVPRELGPHSKTPLCDSMVVWGDYSKRLLVNAGLYSPDQVVVCGFSRIDLLQEGLPPRATILSLLQIPPDSQVVLYASNAIAQELYPIILDSLRKVAEAPVYWVIKLHPREKTRQRWEVAIRERHLERVRVVEGEFDFYALLAACDLHVSFVSTTLIEAAVFGKINLGIDLPEFPDPYGYREAGAFLPVSPQHLGEAASEILRNAERRQALLQEQRAFAQDWCEHGIDATQCIARFVEESIQRGRG